MHRENAVEKCYAASFTQELKIKKELEKFYIPFAFRIISLDFALFPILIILSM